MAQGVEVTGRRTLDVAPELIVQFLRQGNEVHVRVAKDGLPDDAQVVDALPGAGTVRLVFESESWEGESGPINPMLTKLPCAPPVPVDLESKLGGGK